MAMVIARNAAQRATQRSTSAHGRVAPNVRCTRILFLVSAHNGLSQRAWTALTGLGHEVAVAVVDSAAGIEKAVGEQHPDLIVCPFLETIIPESIWSRHRCLIVHPGARGGRGPSWLDWAIELRRAPVGGDGA